MVVLLHYRIQNLNEFKTELVELHQMYEEKTYGIDKPLKKLLKECADYYKQIGKSKEELQVNELKTYLQAAQDGYDPKTLEKIRTHKRSNLRIAVYHCLSSLGECLRASLAKVDERLKEAKGLLNNLILSIIQSGTISNESIQKCNSIKRCELLWEKLKEDDQISIIDRKLKLNIAKQDIYILLDDIFTRIRQ